MLHKLQKFALISLIAFSGLAGEVNIAKAETSGWVTPNKMYSLSRKMRKEKLLPLKLECRGDSRSSFIRDSMEIRLTYGPNPSKKDWIWGWGANFGFVQHQSAKRGFKLVSALSFTRPKTGLLVRCGVFHKAR